MRPRLFALLDQARQNEQHTMLFAGTGYGKTALLGAWAEARSGVAWVTLDAEDSALNVFLAYVIAAFEKAVPGFRTEASTMLPRAKEREGALAALSALLTDLDEQIETPITLVLDDYHLAASPSLDGLLARALRYLPSAVRVVILARRAPQGLELAALQARRLVSVLDEADLAFDEAELATLCPDLDATAIATLHESTGGWPAANGMSPALLDAYLDEQVLVGQPLAVRALLMRLALVDSFDSALAEEALGEHLTAERRNWLLEHRLIHLQTSLGTEAGADRWTLAPLLRDLLRRRFAAEVPRDDRLALLRSIGDYYFKADHPSTALRFWVDAGEVVLAAERLETVAEEWLAAGRQEVLSGAIAALAASGDAGKSEAARPALLLAQGELHRRWGDFERAEQLFEEAVAAHGAGDKVRSLARLRQAQTAASRGQVALARERLAEVADTLAADDRYQLDVLIVEGGLALLSDDTAIALQRYERALHLSRRLNDRYAEARAIHNLGVCYTRLGDFRRAFESYDAAVNRTIEEDGTPAVWMTPINRALVLVYLERPQEARDAAEAVLEMARRYRLGREEGYALRILGLANQRLGDLDTAQAAYEAAELLARRANDTLGLAYSLNFQAERAAQAGEAAEARRLADEVVTLMGGPDKVVAISEFAAVRARILIAEGRLDEATELVDQLATRARSHGYKHLAAETENLTAEIVAQRAGAAPKPLSASWEGVPALAILAPPELSIRCFGGLRVSRGEAVVGEREWQTARAKHLLAFLLHEPEGATKAALFEAIYPQEEVTDASMNMTLMRLRKALEPGLEKGQPSRFILRADGRYSFNWQRHIEVDTQAFDSALRSARHVGTPIEEISMLERAIATYKGEFLPEVTQEWAIALRHRFSEKALDACRRLLLLYDEHRPTAITGLLHRALEIDPLSEEFNRELILRYLEAGEAHRARQHYQLVERRFREMLDSAPPGDLATLVSTL